MFKVKVSSKFRVQFANKMRETVNAKFVEDLEREVVGEVKRLINAGTSPVANVEGKRRFDGYKTPDKYPAKKKAKRPVNLFLTGIMLAWYKVKMINGVRVSYGIPTDAPSDVKDRAEGNNIGTTNSKGEVAIAARRFIPLAGETFAISVMRKMKALYAKRIKSLLSNK